MVFADLPPQQQDRVVCAISAAVYYEIPANIVLAVAEQEAGRPGLWVSNTNGTYDVGSMQFNTAYLQGLAKYGITPRDVAAAGCYSFDLAAWRLRKHLLHDKGDIWTRVADYHSYTPVYNAEYRGQIMVRAERWAQWLEKHFVTYDVTPGHRPIEQAPGHPAPLNTVLAESKAPVAPVATPEHPAPVTAAYVPRSLVVLGASNGP